MKKSILMILTVFLVFLAGSLGLWRSLGTDSGLSDPGESLISPALAEAAEKQDPKSSDAQSGKMIDPATGKKVKYWVAPMDPKYIRYEPGQSPMGMDLVPVFEEEGEEKEPTSTIRIDPVTMQNMGVRTAMVQKRPLEKVIRAYGNITYDERKIYTVTSKFNGWIEKLYVDFVGEKVKKGQPLFEIYSPELVTAQQEYLLALEQYNTLGKSDYPSIRDGARRLLDASKTRLRYWDLTEKQVERISKTGETTKTLTVYSPAKGVVIKKIAFEGHQVKAGAHQYEIADLSRVWVDVEIYEYELPWVQEGMDAKMELSYIPGRLFEGKVLYIYPFLTAKTRTAKLRLQFDNRDSQLKPGMYANVVLQSKLPGESVVVPQEAVIDSGVRKLVFIAAGKGRFQPREVTLGMEVDGHQVQVLEGLEAGEEIVLSAQFMLDSESRLQEAISKMLEARGKGGKNPGQEMEEDLDMGGLSMDDDMDMDGLTMDGDPQ